MVQSHEIGSSSSENKGHADLQKSWRGFEIVVGANSNGLIKLIVARLPGRLAVTLDHLQIYLATIVTIALCPQPVESHENICYLKIKMWFSWAWNGRIPLSAKVGEFLQPWYEAARVFGMKNYLRTIIKGRQTMPECSFSDLAFPNEELRLHTILSLEGDGKKSEVGIEAKNGMAMFLLSNGANIQQTAHFVDGALKHISVQSVNLIMAETNDQKKLKALQQVAQSLNIEWPKFTRSEASKIDKTKAWAKQKMRKPTQVCAEQFQLIPGAFMNEDKTHSAIKQAVTPGSTGVVLLSPEKAAPWIQEHAVISSDEFAIVVLGHKRPAGDKSKCCPLQFPALIQQDREVILAGCLHSIGEKKIRMTQKIKDITIQVDPSVVVAITIFRDELAPEEWDTVVRGPMKFAIQALEIAEDSGFVGSPWSRSWFLYGSKSAPCDASSVQFHVRLSKTKLDGTLKCSGQQGTYVTSKQDGNVADSSFAIVWIDAEAIALIKRLVKVPIHFGLVRTSKGKGLVLRRCRGVRCKCDDFPTVFVKLRPSDTAPKHPKIAFMYTVQPVPIGATPDDIQKWMQAHEWEGRPVKALRNQTWLIGSAKEINDKFLTWGGKSIMIRQTNSKYEKPQSAVIAGFVKHDHDPKQGQKTE